MPERMNMVDRDNLAVAIIDVQPFFLDGWMAGSTEVLLARLWYLLALATAYELPLIATFEQPVETKGWFPEKLEPGFPHTGLKLTKQTFNCCAEPSIADALRQTGKSQIAVAGGETDVCVLQSVLGMIESGYEVFLLEDALFSSEEFTEPAIRRMERAGAIPSTVKTLAYELRRSVAEPQARALFQQYPQFGDLGDPEDLPTWGPVRGSQSVDRT